jgi:hypothetical protein
MHQIAHELPEYEHFFTPYYADGFLDAIRRMGLIEFSILGNKMVQQCLTYLRAHKLNIDFQGRGNDYDLVVTCSDLIVPHNIRKKNVILVQEGMTDPENLLYHVAKRVRVVPRWLASTSTTGLSDMYDIFCVASEGYRDLFIRKGVRPEKIKVTGIPNFDNCFRYHNNSFPHRNFVLVCTSDMRETYKYENRKKFIMNAVKIARGRQLIFKLHPNENFRRARREIAAYAPGALVYETGSAEEMIANCDVLITRYSSTVYVGLALGKETFSDFNVDDLRKLTPLQNNSSARNIALACRRILHGREQILRRRAGIPKTTTIRPERKAPSDYVWAFVSRMLS